MQDELLGSGRRLVSKAGSLNAGGGSGSCMVEGRPAPPPPAVAKKKSERLQCLDAVRGLNVMLMVFVDNVGGWFQGWIDHSPWDVVHLADFVMPLFLFMVGVSMAFSMKKYSGPALKWKILWRTIKLFVLGCLTQGANIWLGGDGVNMAQLRIPGILQRIAFAYFVVAMMKLFLPVYTIRGFVLRGQWEDAPRNRLAIFSHYTLHWVVAFAFFFLYVGIMLFAHVPSWSYTTPGKWSSDKDCYVDNTTAGGKVRHCHETWIEPVTYHTECDTHGDLTPKCSATRMVDSWLIGYEHMYGSGEFTRSKWCSGCPPMGESNHCPLLNTTTGKQIVIPGWCHARLDPEGILSSVPTVLTTWLGLHFGLVLSHHQHPGYRLKHWGALSTVFFALGWIISPFWGMNKQTWSPSYLFFMAGSCGYLLIALYVVYDLPSNHPLDPSYVPFWMRRFLRRFFEPARWVGMNTIFVYIMAPSAEVFGHAQNWIYFNDHKGDNVRDLIYSHVFCNNPIHHKSGTPLNMVPINEGGNTKVYTSFCTGGMFDDHPQRYAQLAWTIFRIAFWTCVAGELHRRRWYWAL